MANVQEILDKVEALIKDIFAWIEAIFADLKIEAK